MDEDEEDVAVLLEFLEKRGCLDSLQKIKEEKVDCHTLVSLSDEQLKVFIPKIGDIHAARRFCKKYIDEQEKDQRKQSLFEKFKRKMSKRRNEDTDSESGGKVKDCRKLKMTGNTNARKERRKIVIGWFNYHQETKNFRQVREKHGGGSREVKVDKSWKAGDILKFGKTLFFPDGKSQMGNEEDFDFSLKDFQQSDISPDTTVSEMYQESHIKLLKFYVFSRPKELSSYERKESTSEILNVSKPSSCMQSDPLVRNSPVDNKYHSGPVQEDFPSFTTDSGTGSQLAPHKVAVSCSDSSLTNSNTGSLFLPVQVIFSNSGSPETNPHNGNLYQHEEKFSDIASCTASSPISSNTGGLITTSSPAVCCPERRDVQTVDDSISGLNPSLTDFQNEIQYQHVNTEETFSSNLAGSYLGDTHIGNPCQHVQAEEIIVSTSQGSFLANNQNGNQYEQAGDVVASTSGSSYLQHVRVDEDILFSVGSMNNLHSLETQKSQEVKVHQGNCFTEMLHLFHDSEMSLRNSHVRRILPNGEEEKAEGVGLIRDILTEFWSTFYLKCCEGHDIKIPILRHDMGEDEWKAVGRIICDGYETVEYFPVKIAKAVIEDACFGTHQADYTTEFLKFLPQSERMILQTALTDFKEADFEELLEVLDSHGCKKAVTSTNLPVIIQEISHKEIIQEPKFIIECWRAVFGEKLMIDQANLKQIYEAKQPTVKKLLQLLILPPVMLSKEQSTVQFLKRFIKGLDVNGMQNFLRFCTGSDLIGEKIIVEFTSLNGFQRRPTAQTCGCILNIPTTYESYVEMKEEFYNVLTSNVWEMGYV